jgi:hypothetical protein
MLRWTLKICLFLACFYGVKRFCHIQTEGFSLQKILSNQPYSQKWETGLPSAEIAEILKQPFYFLGSGGQCYAFVSADNAYVIKFFKQHHMRPLPWLENLPLPSFLDYYRKKILRDREKRGEARIFSSYKIAYENLRNETAFLYLHLTKTDLFHRSLTLVDKLGIAHQIDLDTTEFALQKRATLTYRHLKKLLRRGEIEAIKECISSLLNLFAKRGKLGIQDMDPVISKNFGFIGTEAIEIDLGSFVYNDDYKKPYYYKRDLFNETFPLKRWLAKKHQGELLEHYQKVLDEILNSE